MARFFPQHTGAWKAYEAESFQRLSVSLIEMAAITGVVVRVYRAVVLSHGEGGGWAYVGGTFALGVILLFGLTTLHLGNFTVKQWLWRAPAFASLEALTETLASLGLIALGREPLGSGRATFSDWPGLAIRAFFWRVLAICLFALLLAGVVQLIRFLLLRHEHRDHTFRALHTHENGA